ncbi:FliA/WhiG family RNA polymerase sigma factor [Nocardioides sp. GXZ039]|uniref:FliA/WhiG family RNA polymerase sigma factor n=1 Tax=Nocardioides sp. GXZ039 TaxID=3136018 RepID=UPI0030F3DD66
MTVDVESVDDLWRRYKDTGAPELRNQLVIQYSPLVKYVAGRVRSGLPQTVESADLVSEGVIGLMDAIDKYDHERGLQFQTYAVPRIRGAIIDSIRAADWVPRSVRTRLREVNRARDELQQRLNRAPSDEEICEEAGITLAEFRELRERPTSFSHADEEEVAALDDLAPAVDAALEDEDTRQSLLQALATLPERDQIVIALYFFEGLTLGEIGQVLNVTESRVSQLRSRATASLRVGLAQVLSQ